MTKLRIFKNISPITISFVLLIFICHGAVFAQQWHTTLEVLRPSEKSFAKGIDNLLLVNNSVTQPDDFGHALILYDADKGNQSIDLSEAAIRVLFAAAQQFDYSGMFLSVGLVEHSSATGSFFAKNSLSREQTDSLCRVYQSDAVLSLDRVLIYDKLEEYIDEDYNFRGILEVYATTMWTLITSEGTIRLLNRSDTLYWESSGKNSSFASEQLPDRQTALLDVAEYIGEKFALQYISQWERVDRYLYENNNLLISEGLQQFIRKKWETAILIWQKAYEEAKGKGQRKKTDYETMAYSAANIAVAQEISGDIGSAIQWATTATQAFDKINTVEAAQQQVNLTFYTKELQQREKEEQKLSVL